MEKGKLVPKLRFPEFRDDGEWDTKVLPDVCTINPSNKSLPEIFVYIDLESVESGVLKSKNMITRDTAPSRAQRLLQNNDVLFQMVRPYQKNNFYCQFDDDKKYVASTGYAQLRAYGVSEFLYQLIHTENFLEKVLLKCTGSNYPAINSTDLAGIDTFIPSELEQQKIADCLTSLDELITAENEKLDALKTHKKGLMQQLFPREGESVPRLRFPEFEDAGEWENFSGSTIFHQISNKNHNSDLPILAITQEHGAIPREFIDYHVSVTNKSIKSYKVVEIGDFIISLRSFQGGIEYSNYKGICSPAYIILRIASTHSAHYFRHLFKADRFITQLTKNLEGLRDGKMISFKQFSEVPLPIPSVKEQQKIADFLNSIDDEITIQTEKIASLNQHKKGLMQLLFPNSLKVTSWKK